jgi:hypothetical protein
LRKIRAALERRGIEFVFDGDRPVEIRTARAADGAGRASDE